MNLYLKSPFLIHSGVHVQWSRGGKYKHFLREKTPRVLASVHGRTRCSPGQASGAVAAVPVSPCFSPAGPGWGWVKPMAHCGAQAQDWGRAPPAPGSVPIPRSRGRACVRPGQSLASASWAWSGAGSQPLGELSGLLRCMGGAVRPPHRVSREGVVLIFSSHLVF